jgi:cytidine deaminase
MLEVARQAMVRAYAPYSRFPVGACVRSESGRLYAGGNVENAAYPHGQCAEASAIGAMVAAGDRRIVEVVVMAGGDGLCTPCGGCRQRLREFAEPDIPVHVCGPEGRRLTLSLGELLPHAFDRTTLEGRGGSEAAPTAPSD